MEISLKSHGHEDGVIQEPYELYGPIESGYLKRKNETETKTDTSTLPQPSDPGRVSDESIPHNPGNPCAVALDSGGSIGRTADVDQMVSSFLGELDSLSDALQVSRSRPTQESLDSSAPTDVPERAVARKATSYRNIDVLLMDNARSAAGREHSQEGFSQSSHTTVRCQPAQHSFDNALLRLVAFALKSVGTRCRAFYLALTYLARLR